LPLAAEYLLVTADLLKHGRPKKKPSAGKVFDRPPLLKELSVMPKKSGRAQCMYAMPDPIFQEELVREHATTVSCMRIF
jgi:hypothetical protein